MRLPCISYFSELFENTPCLRELRQKARADLFAEADPIKWLQDKLGKTEMDAAKHLTREVELFFAERNVRLYRQIPNLNRANLHSRQNEVQICH
ncbi:hypothetical protein Barb4_04280 [Bacteroidales bacterium Barb4]|nr:hypothetical protein Barb4_04280 [Bacteroidales bacterium Barb4]